jgi:hypothetical protein
MRCLKMAWGSAPLTWQMKYLHARLEYRNNLRRFAGKIGVRRDNGVTSAIGEGRYPMFVRLAFIAAVVNMIKTPIVTQTDARDRLNDLRGDMLVGPDPQLGRQ